MGSTVQIGKKPRPVRERVSKAEWQVRCELAAAHRLVAHFVFVDLTYNHISVRVPGEPDQFFELACRAQVGALAGGAQLIIPAPEACEARVKKFGRVGVYDSKSRDWVASMALVEKLYPDYRE